MNIDDFKLVIPKGFEHVEFPSLDHVTVHIFNRVDGGTGISKVYVSYDSDRDILSVALKGLSDSDRERLFNSGYGVSENILSENGDTTSITGITNEYSVDFVRIAFDK